MTLRAFLILTVVVVVGWAAMPAANATLLADRFGVNPQVEFIEGWEYYPGYTYDGYKFTASSLAPTKFLDTVDYQADDWYGSWSTEALGDYVSYPGTGTYPAGEEPYDTEAYYFDNDETNLYFAMIVGFPSPEGGIFTDTRTSPAIQIVQGDFALDTPGLTGSQTDNWGFTYDYGVDLTSDVRPGSGNVTTLDGGLGDDVYRTTAGSGAWYLGSPDNDVNPVDGNLSDAYTNFDPSYSGLTSLGNATVSWYELDVQYGGNPVLENNWQTYVIEITIPRSLLVTLVPGDQLSFHWLAGCRNDGSSSSAYLTGSGDFDTPEPGTMALMALGLGPVGMWLRSRRRKQG